jgi:hypothetical protein
MIPLLAGGVLAAGFLLVKNLTKRSDTWDYEWFEEDQTTIQERQKLHYAVAFWEQFRSGF